MGNVISFFVLTTSLALIFHRIGQDEAEKTILWLLAIGFASWLFGQLADGIERAADKRKRKREKKRAEMTPEQLAFERYTLEELKGPRGISLGVNRLRIWTIGGWLLATAATCVSIYLTQSVGPSFLLLPAIAIGFPIIQYRRARGRHNKPMSPSLLERKEPFERKEPW